MVCDFAHVGFTAETPLPNQAFPARFLVADWYGLEEGLPKPHCLSTPFFGSAGLGGASTRRTGRCYYIAV